MADDESIIYRVVELEAMARYLEDNDIYDVCWHLSGLLGRAEECIWQLETKVAAGLSDRWQT